MQVWIYSPSRVFSEALRGAVRELGFTPQLTRTPAAEVAFWDLTNTLRAYPPAPNLPTLALIQDEADGVTLLHQRYRGYLTLEEGLTELASALRAVRCGELWAPRQVLARAFDSFTAPRLTQREEEILQLVGTGLSNRAIADELDISTSTVKTHVSNLFDKLMVNSRSELIVNYLGGRQQMSA